MNAFVTTCRPAGALRQQGSMVDIADENGTTRLYLLEMAAQAQIRVPNLQQFGVDGTVRSVAGGATFPHGFMLKYIRPLLGRMAAQAHFILRKLRGAATEEDGTFVRVMAIGANHVTFRHRMMIGQLKLRAHVTVTLVTNRFLRARRLDGQARAIAARLGAAGSKGVRRFHIAAGFNVLAARAVAGFAPGVQRVGSLRHQPRVVGGDKVLANLVMAQVALVGAHVAGARNVRKLHHAAMDGAAGNRDQKQNYHATRQHQPLFRAGWPSADFF